MSSTGRSDVRDPDDFYATPAWTTRAIVPRLGELAGLRILEPSAGRGAIVRELIAAGADPDKIVAVEPHHGRAASIDGRTRLAVATFEDFASRAKLHAWSFDLVVMNPPFRRAEEHIRLACSLLNAVGTVAALVRLPFLSESQCRADFRATHPHDRLELVRRPSFTAEALPYLSGANLESLATVKRNGERETIKEVRARLMRTDSCAYAWGLFGAGRGGRFWTHEEEA